jgi:hypothetical protein
MVGRAGLSAEAPYYEFTIASSSATCKSSLGGVQSSRSDDERAKFMERTEESHQSGFGFEKFLHVALHLILSD